MSKLKTVLKGIVLMTPFILIRWGLDLITGASSTALLERDPVMGLVLASAFDIVLFIIAVLVGSFAFNDELKGDKEHQKYVESRMVDETPKSYNATVLVAAVRFFGLGFFIFALLLEAGVFVLYQIF